MSKLVSIATSTCRHCKEPISLFPTFDYWCHSKSRPRHRGQPVEKDYDELAHLWHESPEKDRPLRIYLGLTQEEYKSWLENPPDEV